jgi:hypothetical protein
VVGYRRFGAPCCPALRRWWHQNSSETLESHHNTTRRHNPRRLRLEFPQLWKPEIWNKTPFILQIRKVIVVMNLCTSRSVIVITIPLIRLNYEFCYLCSYYNYEKIFFGCCDMWDFYVSENSCCLLGCDAVWCCGRTPTFRRTFTLKMEAARPSSTLVSYRHTTRRHNQEHFDFISLAFVRSIKKHIRYLYGQPCFRLHVVWMGTYPVRPIT